MFRRHLNIILMCAGLVLVSIVYSALSTDDTVRSHGDTRVAVHVAGAVVHPGVITLPSGSRVDAAVSECTPSPDADLDAINLAAVVSDGMRIVVPRKKSQQIQQTVASQDNGNSGASANGTTNAAGRSGASSSGKSGDNTIVHLNTATLEELDTLPGIGDTMGRRIIEYRNKNGAFKSIEEIKNVKGIGEKRFNRMKDRLAL